MSVPLIEESGAVTGGSDGTQQGFFSTQSGGASADGNESLLTLHLGDDVEVTRDDINLLTNVVSTAVLLAWLYYEVIA